jgi:Peptidase family M28
MRSEWLLAAAFTAVLASAQIPAEVKPALDHISANDLKGNVSFLASDLLQGRATPSPGLDIAAEFVAARLRAAGLEPAGDDGYFQTAHLQQVEADMVGFKLEISDGKDTIKVEPDAAAIRTFAALELNGVDAVKADASDRKGKVVFVPSSDLRKPHLMQDLRTSGAALVVITGFRPRTGARLATPEDRAESAPIVFVRSAAVTTMVKNAQSLKVTAHIAAPKERPVTLRNVAAILRGSDAKLKDTYILVTAHYDHLGVKAEGQGDRIYNGANDDASGTASMIEVASALNGLEKKPLRSVVFVAFFGEEEGLIGSKWYGRHPVVPLVKTVADINLEHMGRTDDPTGPKLNDATITGFDFSDLPQVFVKAGELTGIKVYKDEKRSDPFFARSDNQALADSGIPAHTMCVAYEFPDYHGVGDEWPKINYENMARVDRMVTLGVWMLAESDKTPAWNASDPQTKEYISAAAKLRQTPGSAAAK